jgi:hypothetical protein
MSSRSSELPQDDVVESYRLGLYWVLTNRVPQGT